MPKDGWDWGDRTPDLSQLPPHLRESLTEPIPLRPGEVYGRVLIYKKTPGLNHPNGRILVTKYYKDVTKPTGVPDGAQFDMVDFTGRGALSTVILTQDNIPPVMGGLIRSFLSMGGTREELLALITES